MNNYDMFELKGALSHILSSFLPTFFLPSFLFPSEMASMQKQQQQQQHCYIYLSTTLVESNEDRVEVLDTWDIQYLDDEQYEYELKEMRGSCKYLIKASFFGITDDEMERYMSTSSQYYTYIATCGASLDDEQEARSGTMDAAMTYAESVVIDKINAGLRKLTYESSSGDDDTDTDDAAEDDDDDSSEASTEVSPTKDVEVEAGWSLPPRTEPLNEISEPFFTYDQVLDIVQGAVAPFFTDRTIKMMEAVMNPDGSRDTRDRKMTRVGLTDFVLRAVAQEMVDRNPGLDTRLGLPTHSILGVLLDKDSGDL